jgi:uncharacterized membrane protein
MMLLPVKFKQFVENIIVGYLTIPVLVALFLFGLAIGLNYLEEELIPTVQWLPRWLSINSAHQVSSILMTIASASVTVVSVTFSITMLTLSLAANQLGARLLPNFMHQSQTQWVIGLFVGIFVFEVVAASMVGRTESFYQNSLTLMVGILLGIIGFFTLLYFIHFVSKSIQLNEVLRVIQLHIAQMLEEQYDDYNEDNAATKQNQMRSDECEKVICQSNGYVQAIDYVSLEKICQKYKLDLQVQVHAGQMVFRDSLLVYLKHKDQQEIPAGVADKIRYCFYLNTRRSITQDLLFAFEQLSEIAVKALSPGEINAYTAINCIDYIAVSLLHTSHKDLSNPIYVKSDMQQHSLTPTRVVSVALDRICRQAVDDQMVVMHLLSSALDIVRLMSNQPFQQAVVIQMQKMAAYYQLSEHVAKDKEALEKGLQSLYAELE